MDQVKVRAAFIKRSGRMRALNYLAKLFPEEFAEFVREGREEAARLYDSLDCLFPIDIRPKTVLVNRKEVK